MPTVLITGCDEGLAAAVRAVRVRPAWRPALQAMIVCQVGLGRLADAQRCADQMHQLDKPDSDGLEQLRVRNPQWAQDISAALRKVGAAG